MLHALELENFKAFGKRARIPFAPITLIFGENSAGKSTILQALYLLKQTLESRDTGALLLPRTENGIVDLGSFQEMLFDHDLEQMLSIRVEATVDDTFQLPYEGGKIAIEPRFKRTFHDEEVILDQVSIYDGKSPKCLVKFRPVDITEAPEEFGRGMDMHQTQFGLRPSQLTTIKCVGLTEEADYWKPEFEWCKKNKKKILRELKESELGLEGFLKHQTDAEDNNKQRHSDGELRETNKRVRIYIDFLRNDLEFFSSDFDLKTYILKRRKEEMETFLGIQVFHQVVISAQVPNHGKREFPLFDKTFDVAQLARTAGGVLEQTLGALFPISPFRIPPERFYTFRGTTPQNVGYRGDLLSDLLFRRSELVEEANEWLKRLEIDYELEVKPVGTASGDLFQVRLIDIRRKERVSVALPDVGFGVSQLLPFIVQSLVSEERIISIEQPEVHVHPKLQADLGDLLAEAIKEPRRNQFIVETHSEHLILRLQRLVRKREIKPEDVSVIYVSRRPEGAKAERLHLDEDGDFIDEWPNGFFLERLREL